MAVTISRLNPQPLPRSPLDKPSCVRCSTEFREQDPAYGHSREDAMHLRCWSSYIKSFTWSNWFYNQERAIQQKWRQEGHSQSISSGSKQDFSIDCLCGKRIERVHLERPDGNPIPDIVIPNPADEQKASIVGGRIQEAARAIHPRDGDAVILPLPANNGLLKTCLITAAIGALVLASVVLTLAFAWYEGRNATCSALQTPLSFRTENDHRYEDRFKPQNAIHDPLPQKFVPDFGPSNYTVDSEKETELSWTGKIKVSSLIRAHAAKNEEKITYFAKLFITDDEPCVRQHAIASLRGMEKNQGNDYMIAEVLANGLFHPDPVRAKDSIETVKKMIQERCCGNLIWRLFSLWFKVPNKSLDYTKFRDLQKEIIRELQGQIDVDAGPITRLVEKNSIKLDQAIPLMVLLSQEPERALEFAFKLDSYVLTRAAIDLLSRYNSTSEMYLKRAMDQGVDKELWEKAIAVLNTYIRNYDHYAALYSYELSNFATHLVTFNFKEIVNIILESKKMFVWLAAGIEEFLISLSRSNLIDASTRDKIVNALPLSGLPQTF